MGITERNTTDALRNLPQATRARINAVAQAMQSATFSERESPNRLVTIINEYTPENLRPFYLAAYARLRNPAEIAVRLRGILNDAAQAMARTQRPRQLQMLQEGQLSGEVNGLILVRRAIARGERFENPIETMSSSNFFEIAKKYPFIDLAFSPSSSHGQMVHLLQRELVADIAARAPGGSEAFYSHMGDGIQDGAKLWDELFDSGFYDPTKPEYFHNILNKCGFLLR